jgi:hypothetical protein
MTKQFKGTNLIDFMERFDSREKRKKYLANIKWSNVFVCSKCKQTFSGLDVTLRPIIHS